jgi:uncharacterized repeat protein (TIGR03803 family)
MTSTVAHLAKPENAGLEYGHGIDSASGGAEQTSEGRDQAVSNLLSLTGRLKHLLSVDGQQRESKPSSLFRAEGLESRLLLSVTPTTLFSFTGGTSLAPTGITIDGSGNLFGETKTGGTSNQGAIWKLASGSSTLTTLYSFTGRADGRNPTAITIDSAGDLFGTALGGNSNSGTIWELAKGASQVSTLYTFTGGTDGASPLGITIDTNGNLFGTVQIGAAGAPGAIWELAKGSSKVTTLYTFTGGADGGNPSGITIDSNGNLYGPTRAGGVNGAGTVWLLANGSSTVTPLGIFGGNSFLTGSVPQAITIDTGGNLFGTAANSGINSVGAVWALFQGTGSITGAYSFTGGTDGGTPSGITIDRSGNLFITTQTGGARGAGTIIKITGVVPQTVTTTTLTASANPISVGQVVAFTATVTAPGGSPTTGTVTFMNGTTLIGTVALGSPADQATAFTNSLPLGQNNITATYNGTSVFAGSSASLIETVASATTTTLAASGNPIKVGQTVAFVATVTSAGGSPVGTVTFMNGSTLIGTVTINSTTHQAVAFTASLPVGMNNITATYNGATGFATSSASLTETVNPAGVLTTTTLVASGNPIGFGQVVGFVAKVTAATGSPTGTVTFTDGSTLIGTAAINSTTQQAIAFTASLPVGANNIIATYNGGGGFATSSASLIETVNAAVTTTALIASSNSISAGQVVGFVATVTSASGSPTGTVTFMNGSTLIGTVILNSVTHQAVAFTTSLPIGTDSITAFYNGAPAFATSSASLTLTVT